MQFQSRCSEQWKDKQSPPENGYGSGLATRTEDPGEYSLPFPKPILNAPTRGLRLCFPIAERRLSGPPLDAALRPPDPAQRVRGVVLVPRPVRWRTALVAANTANAGVTALPLVPFTPSVTPVESR